MKLLLRLFAITPVLFLSSCSTPYQSKGFTGGFSDTQLAPDLFRVFFHGNGYTSGEKAQDYALLRAAEVVSQHGFSCFAVVDESNTTTTSSFTTQGEAHTTGSATVSGNMVYYSGHTTYTPGQTYTFFKPHTGLMVQGFKDKPDGIFTFDAAFLQQSLKQKYNIK